MEPVAEKAPRRMTCWNCRRYSRNDQRCLEGKANPKRKSDSFAVAESLGLRALCHFNPWRDGMAMRMFFPGAPSTIQSAAQSRRGRRRRPMIEMDGAESAPAEQTPSGPPQGVE